MDANEQNLLELFKTTRTTVIRDGLTMGPCALLRYAADSLAKCEGAKASGTLKKCKQFLPDMEGLLRVKSKSGTPVDCFPLLSARFGLIGGVLDDCDEDRAIKLIQGIVQSVETAWQYQRCTPLEKIDEDMGDPLSPESWPSCASLKKEGSLMPQWNQALARVASALGGWSHPGLLLAADLLATLFGCRMAAKHSIQGTLLFAVQHPTDPRGLLANIHLEAVPGGCGLLIPDATYCGYLNLDAQFSTGMQHALVAARKFAEQSWGSVLFQHDWRWRIDLPEATRNERRTTPLQLRLLGPSAEVAWACAMHAAHPLNPDRTEGLQPIDPNIGISCSLANPELGGHSGLKTVRGLKAKTLVGRLKLERIREIVIAEGQDPNDLPSPDQDANFKPRTASNLAKAYERVTRWPRITGQVNAQLATKCDQHIAKYCFRYIVPQLSEILADDQAGPASEEADGEHAAERIALDPRSKRAATRELDERETDQLFHGHLAYSPAIPNEITEAESSDPPETWPGNRVRIFADSGMGKSVFVLQCEQRIARSGENLLPLRIGRTTGEDAAPKIRWNPAEGIENVHKQLCELPRLAEAFHAIELAAPTDVPLKIPTKTRLEWLSWMMHSGRVVFLIDALDQADGRIDDLATFLANPAARHCPAILTARWEAERTRQDVFKENHWQTLRLESFDHARCTQYLGEKLAEKLLLPEDKHNDDDADVGWDSDETTIRKFQWRDLVKTPLLLSLLKELSEQSVDGLRLQDIQSRFDLYDHSVKHLIQKGWKTLSEEQQATLQDATVIRRVLGRAAWFMIRQERSPGEYEHSFEATLEGRNHQKFLKSCILDPDLKHGTKKEIKEALHQVDISTALQVIEGSDENGMAFRHRSFMEFFAACHFMSQKYDMNPDTGEATYALRIREDLKLTVLKEIHDVQDTNGNWLNGRLERIANWRDTLRFALCVPASIVSDDHREWLAARLIEHGNPWVVYQAIKRDGAQFSPELDSLARWLVHRDYPDWFNYREAVSECSEKKSEEIIKQDAGQGLIDSQIALASAWDNRRRDAANLSALRVIAPEFEPHAGVSSDSSMMERLSNLTGETDSWNFLESFVAVEGGVFSRKKLHEEMPDIKIADLKLADFPITNEVFELFCPTHRRERDARHSPEEDHPVIHVNWYMALEFCDWLNSVSDNGRVYRLPTEWEWEWACRWRNERKDEFWWGAEVNDELCWYGGVYGEGPAEELKQTRSRSKAIEAFAQASQRHPSWKDRSSPGLLDLSGNVWEWCTNWFDSNESSRSLRGGSWLNSAILCRSSDRFHGDPDDRSYDIGFRLCFE